MWLSIVCMSDAPCGLAEIKKLVYTDSVSPEMASSTLSLSHPVGESGILIIWAPSFYTNYYYGYPVDAKGSIWADKVA